MRTKLKGVLFLGATILSMTGQSWSTTTVTGLTDIDDATYVSLVNKTQPVYRHLASEGLRLADIIPEGGTDLDGAKFGTFTATAPSYVYVDSSNPSSVNIWVAAYLNSGWYTFMAPNVPSSISATTDLDFTGQHLNGATPGSPYHFHLLLAKGTTTGIVNLTRDALVAHMRGISQRPVLAGNNTGTAFTSSSALTAGWTAKGYFADAAAAPVPGTMDPMSATVGTSVSTVGSTTPITFSSNVLFLDNWNVTTSSTTSFEMSLSNSLAPTIGKNIVFNVIPGKLGRTKGICGSLIDALNAMPTQRIHQTSSLVCYKNTLPLAIEQCRTMLDDTPPATIMGGINAIAATAAVGSDYTAADCTTTVDSAKLGFQVDAPGDLTVSNWTNSGTKITFTGVLGSNAPETFTADIGSLTTITSTSHKVLTFTSPSGVQVRMSCFDTSGYDTSASTVVTSSNLPALLAMELEGLAATLTSITKSTVKVTVAGATS